MRFADNVDPDQRANLSNLIWAVFVCRQILQYPLILKADNEGPDQPARMLMT